MHGPTAAPTETCRSRSPITHNIKGQRTVSNSAIVNKFLDAFSSGDVKGAVAYLTDDFTFHGPIMQASGKDEFIEGSKRAANIADGYEIIHQLEHDDTVATLYNFKVGAPASPGQVTISLWNTIRDGKLASSQMTFDTAALTALLPIPSKD